MPPAGDKIFVGGNEINEYNRKEYYSLISTVFQYSNILPASIAENAAIYTADLIDKANRDKALSVPGLREKIDVLT